MIPAEHAHRCQTIGSCGVCGAGSLDVREHIPEPVGLPKTLFTRLEPGEVLVDEVPNGLAQP